MRIEALCQIDTFIEVGYFQAEGPGTMPYSN